MQSQFLSERKFVFVMHQRAGGRDADGARNIRDKLSVEHNLRRRQTMERHGLRGLHGGNRGQCRNDNKRGRRDARRKSMPHELRKPDIFERRTERVHELRHPRRRDAGGRDAQLRQPVQRVNRLQVQGAERNDNGMCFVRTKHHKL